MRASLPVDAIRLTSPPRRRHTGRAWCSRWRKAPELHREWGRADPITAPEAPAAPATVSGEGLPMPLGRKVWEGGTTRFEPRARRPAMQVAMPTPSGVTAEGN